MNPYAWLGASDFLGAIQKLFPRGAAWPRDPTSAQTGYTAALGDVFGDLQARASTLSEVESDPEQTLELLGDWETDYGLPDPCAGESPTLQQRRAQLVARRAAVGGQSIAYFVGVALSLGYVITITEFKPLRFGGTFGSAMNGQDWAFAWQVNAPGFSVDYFRFGESGFGEPFAIWGNTVLQCELTRIAPAHTDLIFSYS